MDNVKKYLELRDQLNSLTSKMSYYKNSIEALETELGPLEEEAIRLEVIGDSQAAKKQGELKAKKSSLENLKAEQETARKRFKVMNELLPEWRQKAFEEIRAQAKKDFAPKLKDFARAIRAAAKAEEGMREVWNEAERKARQEINQANSPITDWPPILLRKRAFLLTERGWESFLKRMRDNSGYEIE